MQRFVLLSKLHMATVTSCQLHYEGSITVDEELMEVAGMRPYEQVHVSNLNNGERFITYLIPGARGKREVILNGPTARLAVPGDRLIVFAYVLMDEAELEGHSPTVVVLDEKNNIQTVLRRHVWRG